MDKMKNLKLKKEIGTVVLATTLGMLVMCVPSVKADETATEPGAGLPGEETVSGAAIDLPGSVGSITITFDGNGNGEAPQTVVYISTEERFQKAEFPGYEFLGWNTKADGTGDYYGSIGNMAGDCTLYAIWNKYPEGVLNETRLELLEGEKFSLKLKKATDQVEWSSSDKKVAEVSKDGMVTAKSEGKAEIKATQYGVEYTCKVTCKKPTDRQAYGILLSQMMEAGDVSFYLQNLDGKDMYEMVVVDALPLTLKEGGKKAAAACYFDQDEITTKTISIYKCQNGQAKLLKTLQMKNGIYIYASRFTKSRLRICNMSAKSSNHYILSYSGGQISTQTLSEYRGNEYKLVNVYKADRSTLKKLFGYEAP